MVYVLYGDSAIDRPLNWPTVQLADQIEHDCTSVERVYFNWPTDQLNESATDRLIEFYENEFYDEIEFDWLMEIRDGFGNFIILSENLIG